MGEYIQYATQRSLRRLTFEGGGAGSTPAELKCPQSGLERFRILGTEPRLE